MKYRELYRGLEEFRKRHWERCGNLNSIYWTSLPDCKHLKCGFCGKEYCPQANGCHELREEQ